MAALRAQTPTVETRPNLTFARTDLREARAPRDFTPPVTCVRSRAGHRGHPKSPFPQPLAAASRGSVPRGQIPRREACPRGPSDVGEPREPRRRSPPTRDVPEGGEAARTARAEPAVDPSGSARIRHCGGTCTAFGMLGLAARGRLLEQPSNEVIGGCVHCGIVIPRDDDGKSGLSGRAAAGRNAVPTGRISSPRARIRFLGSGKTNPAARIVLLAARKTNPAAGIASPRARIPFLTARKSVPGGGIAFPPAGIPFLTARKGHAGGRIAFPPAGIPFLTARKGHAGGGIAFPPAGIPFPRARIAFLAGGKAFPPAGIAFPRARIPFLAGGKAFPPPGIPFPPARIPFLAGGKAFPPAGIAFPRAGIPFPACRRAHPPRARRSAQVKKRAIRPRMARPSGPTTRRSGKSTKP